MGTSSRIVVVANPTAGRGKAGKRIGAVDTTLRDLHVDHEIRVAGSAAEMESVCHEAGEQGAEIVAVLGGDGTVSCAANGVLGTGAALAVLPAGTGDDFATAIGAGSFPAAVRLLANPKTADVDVVRVRTADADRCFVNIAGAGFDSEVTETANAMSVNLGGTGTYIAALLKTLSRFTPARYDLTIDGEPLTLDAMLVVVGNGVSYGGGMKVLPDASVVDGVLDVCIVEALSKGAFLRAFPKVFAGRHTTHPKVRMARATAMTIEANRGLQVYADGERVGGLPASFEVLPGALPVVVGPEAAGLR
ncbi:MAG: diacylglycerol kinase family lipid kinase [Actinomycetota bacterium]|nr:diacylglycerol kinase family lipid kinase [Actinomycetota bacterium]